MTTVDPPRALSHPLPAGMRDLLPDEALRRRALARRVLEHFALHGYQLVTPPAFEFAEVLERGLGALDPSEVLRFVEPESGEVAALRPDVTPQIARMVATRLGRQSPPIRLCYEGTIVRRRQGRARRHRQVAQAGVELYGGLSHAQGASVPGSASIPPASQAGDLEILELAASVVASLGLNGPRGAVIDLGHASIARALLEPLPPALAADVTDALGQKDASRVDRLLKGTDARALAALCDLHGGGPGEVSGEALLDRAAPLLAGTGAETALRELGALWTAARRTLGSVLRLDLGEVRGFAYYTGAIFHILAPGPGEPIGAGGRYDDLLARFDAPMPAVGFALNLDSVTWAREAAQISDDAPRSAIVACASAEAARPVLEALRARGIAAVAHASASAEEHASAWSYAYLVTASGDPIRYRARPLTAQGAELHEADAEALARAIADQFTNAQAKPAP